MRTLLVADDNRMCRELIRDILEGPELRVVEASNGQEALDLLEEANPDVILLDLEMPVKDGFTTLAGIRSHPRFSAAPVLAVTARVMQWERDRIAEAGFDGCVTKPVNGAELRKRVRELLGVFEKEMKNERGGETAPAGDR